MAKKNTKNAAPKQERPRHDDGKYGEVLYSFSYDMDDINLFNASSLIGPSRIHQVFPIASMLLLLVIIGSLYDREHPIYPLAITAFVLFIGISSMINNWTKVRDWYVTKTNLMQPGDPERRVVVTADTMVVEGPDDAVTTYPLSELKAVALDDDGALAKFGGKRYVYIPARALSDTRYAALVKMLRSRK